MPEVPTSIHRQRRPGPFEWEQVRGVITEQWVAGRSRGEIQQILAEYYGYHVTVRMILTRIQQWGLDRKNKHHEMVAAARKLVEHASDSNRSGFGIRGRYVDAAEIKRYAKRRGMTIKQLACSVSDVILKKKLDEKTGPKEIQSSMFCKSKDPHMHFTLPRTMTSPDEFRVSEELFWCMELYHHNPDRVRLTNDSLAAKDFSFSKMLQNGCEYYLQDNLVELTDAILRAEELAADMILYSSSLLVPCLIYNACIFESAGCLAFFASAMQYLSGYTEVKGERYLARFFKAFKDALRIFPRVARTAEFAYLNSFNNFEDREHVISIQQHEWEKATDYNIASKRTTLNSWESAFPAQPFSVAEKAVMNWEIYKAIRHEYTPKLPEGYLCKTLNFRRSEESDAPRKPQICDRVVKEIADGELWSD